MTTPWDAFELFVKGLSGPFLAWGVLTLGAIYALWRVSIRRRRTVEATWITVAWWVIALLGWLFFMYVAGWSQISASAFVSSMLLLASALAVAGVAYTALQRRDRTVLVVSAGITGAIGFGLLGAMASSNTPWFFALFLGITLGGVLGQLVGHFRILTGAIKAAPVDEPEQVEPDSPLAAGKKAWDDLRKRKPPREI